MLLKESVVAGLCTVTVCGDGVEKREGIGEKEPISLICTG